MRLTKATQSCAWDGKAWQVVAVEPIKPELVPTAALLIVIERRKLTAQLDAIRAALPDQQRREFELYLKMPYTRRDHPLVVMVQQAFGGRMPKWMRCLPRRTRSSHMKLGMS